MATASIAKKQASSRPHVSKIARHGAPPSKPSKNAKGGALSNGRRPAVVSHPGRFGPWGGRYVPETLMAACEELEREYEKAKRDPRFKARLD